MRQDKKNSVTANVTVTPSGLLIPLYSGQQLCDCMGRVRANLACIPQTFAGGAVQDAYPGRGPAHTSTGTLAGPITPGTVSAGISPSHTGILTDDGAGNLTGSGITAGTINYTTGAWSYTDATDRTSVNLIMQGTQASSSFSMTYGLSDAFAAYALTDSFGPSSAGEQFLYEMRWGFETAPQSLQGATAQLATPGYFGGQGGSQFMGMAGDMAICGPPDSGGVNAWLYLQGNGTLKYTANLSLYH